ncbi:BON domain-containing protein [Alteromonas oceanisediminis]|uniref:BON domain-containing protein n=1 Tax=Alteromonas oceanisediminis TaxID=2836180 RepID=UPI001BDABFAB|nr:BON domain-containing protein [Alteromonas oceanisediminis]MBT0586672.1 BON domain-containing protein [Alteromonas oceanisediminis]
MKRSLLALCVAGTLTATAGAATQTQKNSWESTAMDAWIDGKAEATLLFNGNLDSFDINTDVKNGKVILTGKVNNDVDKKLAEELIVGIDGVTDVDNKLTVVMDDDREMDKDYEENDSALTDAKIATVVKTRLLFDSDISGMDIDVDVENGEVTLTGNVDSDAQEDLAVQIAKNASDVKNVKNNLKVINRG